MFSIKPSLTPTRLAERRQRDTELHEAYPGQDVAYLDIWDGDRLTREVVAASPDPLAFQSLLDGLALEVRGRVRLTYVPDPAHLFDLSPNRSV